MDEIITLATAATTAAVVGAGKSAKGLLTSLLGPTVDAWGQILASPIQLRLLKNQIKGLEKAKKICDESNVNIKQVDLKALLPYLNGVALEEDESLQNMWANLFVNYIDASINLTVTVYPSILSQLSTQDVEVLKHIASNMQKLKPIVDDKIKMVTKFLESSPNLIRLGLVNQRSILHTTGLTAILDNFDLSNFGVNFLRACER